LFPCAIGLQAYDVESRKAGFCDTRSSGPCAVGVVQKTPLSQIRVLFETVNPVPNAAPSYNVAPTDNLPIVRYDAKAGSRTLDLMRWGLVPYWAKDIKIGFSTINAMAETVDKKPVFREAFQCPVPGSG
jgi:putative SOS response-associated peptidase YedK